MPDFGPVWIIFRREVRDQFRDWRITMPILLLTLIFPALMNFTARQAANFVAQYDAGLIAERLIPFLLMVVGFFPISISLVISLESFVGEKERGSIEPLLTSPLEDWQLYLGKLLAVTLPPLVAAYLGILVYLIGVNLNLGYLPEPHLVLVVMTLTMVQALVMVSGAVVISTQTTSVRAANLLASFIIIPVAFLIQGESVVMFWGNYAQLWWAVLGLIVVTVLLTRTGVAYFNREELLGRELDVLNFRQLWQTFWGAFKGQSTSLGGWYSGEVWPTLGRNARQIVILFLLFGAALALGALLAGRYPLPPEIIDLEHMNDNAYEAFQQIDFFGAQGILRIWFHNLRVLLGAFLLGVFTYGVLGILLTLLPFAIIGYLMAWFAAGGFPALPFFVAFVLPHGIVEIPAILISGALIYQMGAQLAGRTGQGTLMDGLVRSFADWLKVMVGVVAPMLLFSAVIEALLTPQVALWMIARVAGF
jgi:uncharacterized membrane protein SpoIIM required for sporulation